MRLLLLAALVAVAAADTITHRKTSSAGGSSIGGQTSSRRHESSFSHRTPGDIQLGTRFNNRRRAAPSRPAQASFSARVPQLEMPTFNVPRVQPLDIGNRIRPASGVGAAAAARPVGAAVGTGQGSIAASLQGQLDQIGAHLASIQAQLGM